MSLPFCIEYVSSFLEYVCIQYYLSLSVYSRPLYISSFICSMSLPCRRGYVSSFLHRVGICLFLSILHNFSPFLSIDIIKVSLPFCIQYYVFSCLHKVGSMSLPFYLNIASVPFLCVNVVHGSFDPTLIQITYYNDTNRSIFVSVHNDKLYTP